MSDIGVALRAKLLADGTVSGLVSTRIYPRRMQQDVTLPAIVYHKVGGDDETYLSGLVGCVHQRFQLESWAATKIAADALAIAIRNALCASGGRGLWGTVNVTGCTPQGGPRDSEQSYGDGSDEATQITIRDFLVSYDDV